MSKEFNLESFNFSDFEGNSTTEISFAWISVISDSNRRLICPTETCCVVGSIAIVVKADVASITKSKEIAWAIGYRICVLLNVEPVLSLVCEGEHESLLI
jgi:hypothetical protein